MKNAPLDIPAIKLSIKVYQRLLLAYPGQFRTEYGSHMIQLFGDCCLRAFRQRGMNGLIQLWVITLLDLCRSLIAEHLHKETIMTNPKFVRLSGWALMIGSAALLPLFTGIMLAGTRFSPTENGWYLFDMLMGFGFIYGSILLSLGMLGLRARYGSRVGELGKGFLSAGVFGCVGAVSALVFDAILSSDDMYLAYVIIMTSLALMFLSLLLFGVLTFIRKPLSHGNGLPLAAGLALPMYIKLNSILSSNLTGSGFLVESPVFLPVFVLPSIIGLIVMTVALMRFGYIVQADEANVTVTL